MTESSAVTGETPAEKPFMVAAPQVTLPKGGGAIRGIGEKFAANPVTGTGSVTVPIATSPGRSGFGPTLSLSYDSGSGNGPFGFGWSQSLPQITRKIDKGLPRYRDEAESDGFILCGTEDLVRQLDANGDPLKDTTTAPGYSIYRYRPRIEGLFARIERWTRDDDGDTHWRSFSRDNILTIYGKDPRSRIVEHNDTPTARARVFSWLISETRDDRGNAIVYAYKPEDGARAPVDSAHQRNRGDREDKRRNTNRYLKQIRYGNRKPLLDPVTGSRPSQVSDAQIKDAGWMFEVVLDYGEHDPNVPKPDDQGAWGHRTDAFSSYRSGFEVRTARLCHRFLMFHHFAGENNVGDNCLVRSTDLNYTASANGYAFLQSVTQSGYVRNSGGYLKRSMPPVEYEYSQATVQDTVHDVDPTSLQNLPIGLDGSLYQLVDLHGEGIPGILTEQNGAWYYLRNISPISTRPVEFGVLERVGAKPNATGSAQFMDLAGDGQLDLVDFADPVPGFYEHDENEGWEPFRPFTSRLNRDVHDPNARFIDLNGDGHTDLLVTDDATEFIWHPSLGQDGFDTAERTPQFLDEEQGPRLIFADGTDTIHLADMSGDGLVDLVRIRNSEICYWPNLGYGRFGAKITMDYASADGRPHQFDYPELFDPQRVRLADIDGSGSTDIIYLHPDGVRLYFNRSGNSFGTPTTLRAFPQVDDASAVITLDLHGNGTACLAWSSPLPGDAGRQMRYVDLMGDTKPHLLTRVVNNLGAETIITYASSIKFYLADRNAGRPWATKLPFPVHVVERVETIDYIGRNRLTTRYAYHHGYFDGAEREFRGFGMVEQWDAEQFGSFNPGGSSPLAQNESAASYVPPVHTKTWFHTGIYSGREHVSNYYAGLLNDGKPGEYYREPGLNDDEAAALLLPDTLLPAGLTLDEERQACRALKGSMLRQEVYADDAPPGASDQRRRRAATPYTVFEQNFTVRTVQHAGPNRYCVFFRHPRESLTYHYEREPADPRIQGAITLDVDNYGNVVKQVAIGYGRRTQITLVDGDGTIHRAVPNPGLAELTTATDQAQQTTPLITYTQNDFTNPIDDAKLDGTQKYPHDYRIPAPSETRTYELTGFTGSPVAGRFTGRFTRKDFVTEVIGQDGRISIAFVPTTELQYEDDAPDDGVHRSRVIEHIRTFYRPDDFGAAAGSALALLPRRNMDSRALAGESYKLAFTQGLLTKVFKRDGADLLIGDAAPASVLGGVEADQGGYRSSTELKAVGLFPPDGRDGEWWIPSGRTFLSPTRDDANPSAEHSYAVANFFLPQRFRTPFDTPAAPTETIVGYDNTTTDDGRSVNNLLVVDVQQPSVVDGIAGNRITIAERFADGTVGPWQVDYRVLQPTLISDPNRNRTQVIFDTLGMVVGAAIKGKPAPEPIEGDDLNGFDPDLTQSQIDNLFDNGNPYPAAPDLLAGASTRIVYDLHRFRRTRRANPDKQSKWLPAGVVTLARETHTADPLPPQGLRIQLAYSYSDGYGREIQKKIGAEKGPVVFHGPDVDPRWVGSGWTIPNNKGKPVRQYEPFFSADHTFEYGVTVGVSAVVFYDPLGRVIATLCPNQTYGKVVFDPWKQVSFDANDTSAAAPAAGGAIAQTGDPRTDPDIAGFVADYFAHLIDAATWQTWFTQRIGGLLGPEEQTAAARAAAHADTPTSVHFDTLGRPFRTDTVNRVVCPGHPDDGKPDATLSNRVVFDIKGNQRVVRDADQQGGDPLGRIVMRYGYNMLDTRIHQQSMEAGQRWTLPDITGKPLRAWDSRGHTHTTLYDRVRRPIGVTVQGTTPDSDPRTLAANPIMVEKIDYGDTHTDFIPELLNLRGMLYRHYDSAGLLANAQLDAGGNPVAAFDFKGNLGYFTRRLASDYKGIPDWSANPALDDELFESRTWFDALNRVTQAVAPHSNKPRATINVTQPGYNPGGLLEQIDVWLDTTEPTQLVDPATTPVTDGVGVNFIGYDARGQRRRIDYKNTATTRYWYDRDTFRLTHLYTQRGSTFTGDCDNPYLPPPRVAAPDEPPEGVHCGVQNLDYTYDAAGHITHIRDAAQPLIFFRNQVVEPSNDYTYDATDRLIQATGREHLGQSAAGGTNSPTYPDPFNAGLDANDDQVMGAYTETYVYDNAGNHLSVKHIGSQPAQSGWTLTYTYSEPCQIQDGPVLKHSNRLTLTSLDPDDGRSPRRYFYDPAGNTTFMPHLGDGSLAPNMLPDHSNQLTQVSRGGGGQVYYVYDAAGRRVRKIWEKSVGRTEERIYLGSSELYRIHAGTTATSTVSFERETVHILDKDQQFALIETRTLDVGGGDPALERMVKYQLSNHLGSCVLELDQSGIVVSYEEDTAFGSVAYQMNGTSTPKRYAYMAKERDTETGLMYYGRRYYCTWTKRWTATDPATFTDGLNLFVFVANSPIGFIDNTGGQKAPAPKPGQVIREMVPNGQGGYTIVEHPYQPSADPSRSGSKQSQTISVGGVDYDLDKYYAVPGSNGRPVLKPGNSDSTSDDGALVEEQNRYRAEVEAKHTELGTAAENYEAAKDTALVAAAGATLAYLAVSFLGFIGSLLGGASSTALPPVVPPVVVAAKQSGVLDNAADKLQQMAPELEAAAPSLENALTTTLEEAAPAVESLGERVFPRLTEGTARDMLREAVGRLQEFAPGERVRAFDQYRQQIMSNAGAKEGWSSSSPISLNNGSTLFIGSNPANSLLIDVAGKVSKISVTAEQSVRAFTHRTIE